MTRAPYCGFCGTRSWFVVWRKGPIVRLGHLCSAFGFSTVYETVEERS